MKKLFLNIDKDNEVLFEDPHQLETPRQTLCTKWCSKSTDRIKSNVSDGKSDAKMLPCVSICRRDGPSWSLDWHLSTISGYIIASKRHFFPISKKRSILWDWIRSSGGRGKVVTPGCMFFCFPGGIQAEAPTLRVQAVVSGSTLQACLEIDER